MASVPETRPAEKFQRKLSPVERFFTRSPFSTVTMVARIRGVISERMLRRAVSSVQQRYPVLQARILEGADHQPAFTTDGAGEIPVIVVQRESEAHWINVVEEACRAPFEFERRPAIRFLLVHSPSVSELIILCHPIICDGLSLAYLVRDMMLHLGDPAREVQVLAGPDPVNLDLMPEGVSLNPIARFFINRINKRWAQEAVHFDQQDYLDLNQAYWLRYTHRMLSIEVSESQTTDLVDRCRQEGVTVNSALATAFAGAQTLVRGEGSVHPNIGVAGSLRDRLSRPIGEAMGFYAGVVTLKYQYNLRIGFWDNARRFHRDVRPLFTNKKLLDDPLAWCYLEPAILEAINFKKLGGLVPPHFARHQKLSNFGKRNDVVRSILKRDKMESPDQVFMGTAVTNLTRMDFPRSYGDLELDRLFLKPGGGFPLASVDLVLGAVTCAGKLSLVVEYVEDNIDPQEMAGIKEAAMGFLLVE